MKGTGYILPAIAAWHSVVAAAPQPSRTEPGVGFEDRSLVDGLVGGLVGGLDDLVGGLLDEIHDAVNDGDRDRVLSAMHSLEPTKTPDSVEHASSIVEALAATATASTLIEFNAHLIANGIISGTVEDIFDYAEGLVSEENSSDNSNPDPPDVIYPKAASCDSPYSTPESDLRSAIYIPDGFTYGKKQPVILFPGTGSTGYTAFGGSFIPLLTDVDWADPVWVNKPDYLTGDAQVSAEYAAYALNYIASLAGRDVAIVAWSQGNINTQWAFKYWPSTRKVTTDHIAISADYDGTVIANVVGAVAILNTDSVLQQTAGSDFITTLRADDGDSGYVPTTSIFSGLLDEIVQPQSGKAASAYLLDARGVGVENVEVQVTCKGGLAGSFYTHESLLGNPLAFALLKDALAHDGPGETSRLDLDEVCSSYLAPGLGLDDFLFTENAILIAGLTLALHLPKVLDEPSIKAYTASAPGTC